MNEILNSIIVLRGILKSKTFENINYFQTLLIRGLEGIQMVLLIFCIV